MNLSTLFSNRLRAAIVALLLVGMLPVVQAALVVFCRCTITIGAGNGNSVPDNGAHAMTGTNGGVFIGNEQIADLTTLTVNTNNSLSGTDIIATVTSVSGTVDTFSYGTGTFLPTTWTLASSVASCTNTIVFDKNTGDVSGCFVLDATGGFSQSNVQTNVVGTFDPAGVLDMEVTGASNSFDFGVLGIADAPATSTWALGLTALTLMIGTAVVLRRFVAPTAA